VQVIISSQQDGTDGCAVEGGHEAGVGQQGAIVFVGERNRHVGVGIRQNSDVSDSHPEALQLAQHKAPQIVAANLSDKIDRRA